MTQMARNSCIGLILNVRRCIGSDIFGPANAQASVVEYKVARCKSCSAFHCLITIHHSVNMNSVQKSGLTNPDDRHLHGVYPQHIDRLGPS